VEDTVDAVEVERFLRKVDATDVEPRARSPLSPQRRRSSRLKAVDADDVVPGAHERFREL